MRSGSIEIKQKQEPGLASDVALTALTQVAVMIGTLILYGLIARIFGPNGVGEYTIIRRALYFLQPLILVGVTVAVPRYIAMSTRTDEREQIAGIGVFLVLLCSLLTAVATLCFRDSLSVTVFGRRDALELVYGFAALTLGFGFHSVAYSYYRGLRDMSTANRLDLFNSCLAPLTALVLTTHLGLGALIGVLGMLMIFATVFFSTALWKDIGFFLRKRNLNTGLTTNLLRYGVSRIPGDLALAGLLFGGTYIVAREASIQQAGYFGVAQTLLMLPGAALFAISVVLLPYVSERLTAGDFLSVQINVARLFQAIADVSVYFSLHVALFADVIIRLWLGEKMHGAEEAVRTLMVSVPFYSIFFVFRSVIDAASHKPVTTFNLIISFICFVALYFVFKYAELGPSRAVTWALSVAFVILGVLTIVGVKRHVGIEAGFYSGMSKAFLTNVTIALAVFWARYLIDGSDGIWIVVELLCALTFLLSLYLQKRIWIAEFFGQASQFLRPRN